MNQFRVNLYAVTVILSCLVLALPGYAAEVPTSRPSRSEYVNVVNTPSVNVVNEPLTSFSNLSGPVTIQNPSLPVTGRVGITGTPYLIVSNSARNDPTPNAIHDPGPVAGQAMCISIPLTFSPPRSSGIASSPLLTYGFDVSSISIHCVVPYSPSPPTSTQPAAPRFSPHIGIEVVSPSAATVVKLTPPLTFLDFKCQSYLNASTSWCEGDWSYVAAISFKMSPNSEAQFSFSIPDPLPDTNPSLSPGTPTCTLCLNGVVAN